MKNIIKFIEEYLAAIAMVVMTVLVFLNVVCRHLLHLSFSFTEEITCALFVLVCVMGTSLCAKKRAHLGMSFVSDLMDEKGKRLLSFIGNLLAFIFCLILLITGVQMVLDQIKFGSVTPALAIPAWIYGIFLPIGAVFMTLRFGECALEDFKAWRKSGKEDKKS